jgi:hypothetical protein
MGDAPVQRTYRSGASASTQSEEMLRFAVRNIDGVSAWSPLCAASYLCEAVSSEREWVFVDSMCKLDPGNRDCSIGERLEAAHGSAPLLDRAMILFNDIGQIL